MKYNFSVKIEIEIEEDLEEDACKATAKIFETSARVFEEWKTWKRVLRKGFDETKRVRVYV
jgi:hypothetical protein